MIDLPYSLVIEATEEPDFFGFYSEELEGFSGVGHSVEDCLFQARWGMKEHVELLRQRKLPVPSRNPDAVITIRNVRPRTRRRWLGTLPASHRTVTPKQRALR